MGLSTKEPVELSGQTGDQADRLAKQVAQHSPADAVCIEIPVRISGARVVAVVRDITEHTEQFRETTGTLIVFARGAVVRLFARVRAGQLLTLTNLRTKREASCRVVSVRTSAEAKSYIELEFTEQASGFWGITFPSELATGSIKPAVLSAIAEPAATGAQAGSGAPDPATPGPSEEEKRAAAASSSDALPGARSPLAAPSLSSEPMASPAMAEVLAKEQKEPLINLTLSAPATAPTGSDLPIERPLPPEELRIARLPLERLNRPSEPVVPTPLADEIAVKPSAPWAAASPSRGEFLGSFGKSKRATGPSKQPSLSEILGITPEQEPTTRRAAFPRQPRRKLVFALVLVPLVAALVGAWIYLHQQPGSISGALASTSPTAAEGSASPDAGLPAAPPGMPPDSSATGIQAQSSASPEGQLTAQGQAPASVVAGSSEGNRQPAADAPFVPVVTSDMTIENLSSRPTMIEKSAVPTEQPAPPVIKGGVPGGVANGQAGVMGAIISGSAGTASGPPPPPVAKPQPARPAGGRLLLPRLLRSVLPAYPILARQNRVEGDVVIQTKLDAAGNVVHMKIVSGSPLLQEAALEALRRWKYAPAKLDDRAVPIEISVVIRFRLR